MNRPPLAPAVLAEDLRALAEHGHRLDNATVDVLLQAADQLDQVHTEWGTRLRNGQTIAVDSETHARAVRSATTMRRDVGPWTEAAE